MRQIFKMELGGKDSLKYGYSLNMFTQNSVGLKQQWKFVFIR